MEIKHLDIQVKAGEAEGVIEGYGSVFGNTDAYGDRIDRGAFADSLRARKPKMLWQHDMDEPVGVWDEVSEDDRGLRVKGRLALGTARGRDAQELIGMGAMDGLSIGFRARDYEMDGNNRVLKSIDLYEVSLVTMPANLLATITDIRSMDDAPAVERAIREALKLSRNEAKAFMSGGFKGLLNLRDAGAEFLDANQRDVEAVKSKLKQLLEQLK
jgi:HK97 family phage prohead protease